MTLTATAGTCSTAEHQQGTGEERRLVEAYLVDERKPIFPFSCRLLLASQSLMFLLAATGAHYEAAGVACLAAALTATIVPLVSWSVLRRRTIAYSGRILAVFVLLLAIPAVGLPCAALFHYDLIGQALWQPAADVPLLLLILAIVLSVPAIVANQGDDGGDSPSLQASLSLADIAGRARLDFPPSERIIIPPGLGSGGKIRVIGHHLGEATSWLTKDVIVTVTVEADPRFTVDENNLHMQVHLCPAEALRGTAIELDTLDGSIRASIPPMVRGKQKIRLKGLGLPRNKRRRGHLYVHVQVRQSADWQAERVNTFMTRIRIRSLTMSEFEQLLANIGYDRSRRPLGHCQLYVVHYQGRDISALETITLLIRNLNRVARQSSSGSLQIALVDTRSGTATFPLARQGFWAELSRSLNRQG